MKYLAAVLVGLMALGGCARRTELPAVGSEQYQRLCSAFYLGLAALQSGEDVNARKGLTEATNIASAEPAGWLNLSLLEFRQQNFEGAFSDASRATALVGDNSRMEALLGVIESRRGKIPEAIGHLERAVQLDGRNLKAAYALAQETERQNSDTTDAKAQQLLERILTVQANNLAVLLDDIRLAAKHGDTGRLKPAVASLAAESATWPEPAKQQLKALQTTAAGANVRAAAVQVQFLKNVLVRVPAYRQSLDQVRTPATSAGEPFLRFFKLPSPQSEPDAPDMNLVFEQKALCSPEPMAVRLGAVALDGESQPVCIWTDGSKAHLQNGATLELPRNSRGNPSILTRNWMAAADLDYDFKVDLVFASTAGLRIYQQTSPKQFVDVTRQTKLSEATINGSYSGVWAFDYDLDGDLDLVLGVREGSPLVLRNNGDGTFLPVHPFPGVEGLLDFASADVDGDGDPDVALIDSAARLAVFDNQRLGDYQKREVPAGMETAAALTAGDVNGDTLPDFVILGQTGRVFRLSDAGSGKGWVTADVAKTSAVDPLRGPSLLLADLDNNGALDLVANGNVFLSDGKRFSKVTTKPETSYTAAVDLDGDGVIDLLGFAAGKGAAGEPAVWNTRSSKAYHWQTIRPRAARTSGDQRINSFGLGGEVEIRADLLTQKQIIRDPQMHFGMGSHHAGTEFARIGWPNGLIQTEFGLKADQTLLAEQRLKGSCPFLFAWSGQRMDFVADVGPMSGALGPHNADGNFAEVSQTRQWFKMRSDQLRQRDGIYDLRVTNEYWETYYIDQYSLLAVDHPVTSHLFVDERVAVPAAPLRWYLTGEPQAFATARDETGRDVRELIREADGKYLDTFQRDTYRGIARDHYVELELPDTAPRDGKLLLLAEGWLHPWDDSTLVAVSQGGHAKPRDLTIEVADEAGSWHVAKAALGVPAGRRKTVVFDLSDLFQRTSRRRLRLRTNLEIYWDRIVWTVEAASTAKVREAGLRNAELRPRGYSTVEQASSSSPEVPVYERLATTGNRWHNLEGYYTRFGGVEPLLSRVDGRYVIAGSGDELRLQFGALPDPQKGWVRDFIFVTDGWLKEGDLSFRDSKTVLPLPYLGLRKYQGFAGTLESDRGYRLHPDDWRLFHTRYVGSEFGGALWP